MVDAALAVDADSLAVSVAGESARILKERSYRLIGFHLIIHRTLHLTRDVHEAVVRSHNDDVVVGKTYIARKLAVEDIVIDIYYRNKAVVAINLDVTQRTYLVRAASHVKGVEDSGKGRERIRTRSLHLAHHVHHDGAGLSHGQTNLAAAVAAAKCGAQTSVGLRDGQTAYLYRTEALDGNATVRRNRTLLRLLRRSIHVHEDGITRTETIVLRSGDVHVRLEGKLLIVKDIASEHLLLSGFTLGKKLLQHLRRIGHHLEHLLLIVHKLLVGFVVRMLIVTVALRLHTHIRVVLRIAVCLTSVVFAGVLVARLAVVGAQTCVRLCRSVVANIAKTALFQLALIFIAHAAYLRNVNATLHEVSDNLRLRLALLLRLHDVLHNLRVGHGRLCRDSHRHDQHED